MNSINISAKVRGRRELLFNPLDPSFNADPYPFYGKLRTDNPLHWSPMGFWVAASYDDVRTALKDPRFVVKDIPDQIAKKSGVLESALFHTQSDDNLARLSSISQTWLPFIEAPTHTRLRKLVGGAFQPRTVEKLRRKVSEEARRLIERVWDKGELDIMDDFARKLPFEVMASMLGIPRQDFSRLMEWTESLARILDPLVSLAEFQKIENATRSFSVYLQDVIADHREKLPDDFLTALILVREAGDALEDEELISIVMLLFIAGVETTVNLIGNGMLALLRNPARMADLRSHPEWLPAAVEEMLRFDSPLQMTSRVATEDLFLGGQKILKSQQVYLLVGSANRDPKQFDSPDELDWTREPNQHLAFAVGHHVCLGASLARLEAQEAFRTLLEMLPDIALAIEVPNWRPHTVLRGMTNLPVKFAVCPAERGQSTSPSLVPPSA